MNTERGSAAIRDRLAHVRWLGGGSGAGKSTIAARLADLHGLRCYSTDDSILGHAARSDPALHPRTTAFIAMTMDERRLDRSPAVMLDTFHGFRGEQFELIVEDLLAMPVDRPILVEGFRLLPRLVAPLLSELSHGAWLLPTAAFRRTAFERRGTVCTIADKTSDPLKALENLLSRDAMFTNELAAEATALGLMTIAADGVLDLDSLTERVATALGLGA